MQEYKGNIKELKDLLTHTEGRYYERKAAEINKLKVADTLISFANQDGGTIAIGIKNRKFQGINHLSPHKITDFEKIGIDLIKPALKVDFEYVPVDINGKSNRILLLSVKPSVNQIYSNNKNEVFLRVGDDTKKLTYKEIESLEFDKGIRSYEQKEVDDAILNDLDEDVLKSYKEKINYSDDNIWNLLFSRGLAKRIVTDGKVEGYKLNVAGVLLFAKKPDIFIPGARIRFIRYAGKKTGVGENLNVIKEEIITGPLTKQIEQANKLVQSQLREFTSLDLETGRFKTVPEYPDGTWLEGIVNAVTHRAYNLNGDDIRIIMYDDKLVIHSPGSLPSIVTVDNIRYTHYSRNPNIARALVDLGWVREFGEGVNRMYEKMEKYFLENPSYKVSEVSTDLTLYNNIVMRNIRRENDIRSLLKDKWESLTNNEKKVVIYTYEYEKLKPKYFIENATDMRDSTVRNILKKLVNKKVLRRIGTSKTDPNAYYELNLN